MAKNNIANSIAPTNTTEREDRLFTNYINTYMSAEEAAYKIREAIFAITVNNTAVKTRVDKDFYCILIQEAKKFVFKKSIKLYKDDNYIRTYTFSGNNHQQVLHELQKFFKEIIFEYNCYYEDRISYEDREGFCWKYNGMKIAIV